MGTKSGLVWVAFVGLTMSVSACIEGNSQGDSSATADVEATTSDVDEQGGEASQDVVEDGDEAPRAEESVFIAPGASRAHGLATSDACVDCHSNEPGSAAMRDEGGRGVAPYDLWQASMKANSARDPFFRAVLSAEVTRHPAQRAAIEAKCLRCHAPLASVGAERAGVELALGDIEEADDLGHLGVDGVSCVACHAMEPDGMGDPEGFGGGFSLNEDGVLWGPHEDPFARPMVNRSGWEPRQSDHMRDSAQCASCHTLHTNPIVDGEFSEQVFPEQTPYLEWQNSRFSGGEGRRECQDCHVPTTSEDGVAIETYIARRPMGGVFGPTQPRAPFGRHLYIGGNYTVPGMLRDERDILQPLASDEAFDETIAAVKAQLRERTARLELREVDLAGSKASFEVVVRNLTGHKFPSAYPSRRAWLRVVVRGRQGEVLFESGGWNEEGQIVDGGEVQAFERRGGPVEPHRDLLSQEDQVVLYEAVMADRQGAPTVGLLRAWEYLKDNRLLPEGWRADFDQISQIEPVGVDEANFRGGEDVVRVEVSVDGEPESVEVELVYQPLGARWMAELFATRTAEVERFERMYRRSERTPVRVDLARYSR